jgi:CysZ protein
MGSIRPPRPLPPGAFALLARGSAYPLEGLAFIGRARLWPLASLSVVVNVVVLAALVAAGLAWALPLAHRVEASLQGWAAGGSVLGVLAAAVGWLLALFTIAVVLALSALALVLVGQAVASPFLDLLSERVESLVLGTQPAPQSLRRLVSTIRLAVADLVWSLLYAAAAAVPVMVLGFLVPPAGAALGFLFSSWLVALEFVGLSLARRLVPFRQRGKTLRGRRALGVGFGATCTLLLAVPGLNLLLLPLAAAGGTLLYCDLEAARRLEGTRKVTP